jgi:hypothetical protein
VRVSVRGDRGRRLPSSPPLQSDVLLFRAPYLETDSVTVVATSLQGSSIASTGNGANVAPSLHPPYAVVGGATLSLKLGQAPIYDDDSGDKEGGSTHHSSGVSIDAWSREMYRFRDETTSGDPGGDDVVADSSHSL